MWYFIIVNKQIISTNIFGHFSSKLPKEFEKTSEVLPFTKYGISTLEEFKTAEETVQNLEWFKKVGLTNEEVKLYQDDVAGRLDRHQHIESSVLSDRLEIINKKINEFRNKPVRYVPS